MNIKDFKPSYIENLGAVFFLLAIQFFSVLIATIFKKDVTTMYAIFPLWIAAFMVFGLPVIYMTYQDEGEFQRKKHLFLGDKELTQQQRERALKQIEYLRQELKEHETTEEVFFHIKVILEELEEKLDLKISLNEEELKILNYSIFLTAKLTFDKMLPR